MKAKVNLHGDPTNMGFFGGTHQSLKRYYKLYGCPLREPEPILKFVALAPDVAQRLYGITLKENVHSVIVRKAGWRYKFKVKTLEIWTGIGGSDGIVVEQSDTPLSQWKSKSYKGNKVYFDLKEMWDKW